MSTEFTIIAEEFTDDLGTIRALVNTFADSENSTPKARIAAANSATLLLAATFEEFVREMARAYAKAVVASCSEFERIPRKLINTAWRRTMETLARIQIEAGNNKPSPEGVFADGLARFSVVYEFCKGDLSQNIYDVLIHNENNMRAKEINSLFKVSDLQDVCSKLSEKTVLLENFGETDPPKAHGRLIVSLDDFFERRNKIAHSLHPAQSSGPDQILKDINMLEVLGKSLCETLDVLAPHAVVSVATIEE